MKIPIPYDLTTEQAKIALVLLETLIDALMDCYYAIQRAYSLHPHPHCDLDDDWPF